MKNCTNDPKPHSFYAELFGNDPNAKPIIIYKSVIAGPGHPALRQAPSHCAAMAVLEHMAGNTEIPEDRRATLRLCHGLVSAISLDADPKTPGVGKPNPDGERIAYAWVEIDTNVMDDDGNAVRGFIDDCQGRRCMGEAKHARELLCAREVSVYTIDEARAMADAHDRCGPWGTNEEGDPVLN